MKGLPFGRFPCIMHKEYTKRLHTVCGIVTAVLVLMAGICFIISCLSIYKSGDRPFSPESVATHFRAIRIPVIACIVSIAVSGILSIVFPVQAGRTKAIREEADILAVLKGKAGSLIDKKLAADSIREQTRQRNTRHFISFILTAAMIQSLIFFADASHFTVEGLNHNILTCILVLSVSCLISLVSLIVNAYLTKRSLRRQIAIYKAALAEGKCDGIPTVKDNKTCKHTVLITRCTLFAIAVVFIILGIFNGGVQDVLGKAIAICTECIGLG